MLPVILSCYVVFPNTFFYPSVFISVSTVFSFSFPESELAYCFLSSTTFSLASSYNFCSGCGSSILARHRGPNTAATVVVHSVAVVRLHSPVLHLSCTASPRGVILADLLWQLKCSTEQNGNHNLYLPTKIPRYPFSEAQTGLERPEWWVMEAVRLKVSRYIYCHRQSVSVIGDSLSPLDGKKSGNTI